MTMELSAHPPISEKLRTLWDKRMTSETNDGGTMTAVTPATGPGTYNDRVRLRGITAALLAVLTLIEYAVAINVENPLILLLPFVLAKGALIMDFFMHIRKLKTGGDH